MIDSQPAQAARACRRIWPVPACLAELFDPATAAGGIRLSTAPTAARALASAARLPYDRAHTSLAGFALCADCAGEYRQPADRRFHAEPIACPHCGPWLSLCDLNGSRWLAMRCRTPWPAARRADCRHQGRGRFHLVCDADQPQAVAMLRAQAPAGQAAGGDGAQR